MIIILTLPLTTFSEIEFSKIYVSLGLVRWEHSRQYFFRFLFILHTAYTVDALALTSILLSLSLIDMIYCAADTKTTLASVLGVGVDFYIDMDFSSPQRCENVFIIELRYSVVLSIVQTVMDFERFW
jgi:hypothetical protein